MDITKIKKNPLFINGLLSKDVRALSSKHYNLLNYSDNLNKLKGLITTNLYILHFIFIYIIIIWR